MFQIKHSSLSGVSEMFEQFSFAFCFVLCSFVGFSVYLSNLIQLHVEELKC